MRDAMTKQTADAVFLERASESKGEPAALLKDRHSHYTDPETLSEAEAEIFGLDLRLVGPLSVAYDRYLSMIGTVDNEFFPFREQERLDNAELFDGDGVWDPINAARFMVKTCGLDQVQCQAWVCKVWACGLRGGLHDEELPG